MLINYLKIAIRSLLRNKLASFINIAGLALALTSAMLIVYYITDELSYDRQHPFADRTYRVTRYFYDNNGNASLKLANVAPPVGMHIRNDFPEVETLFRMLSVNTTVTIPKEGQEGKSFREQNIFVSEPEIFDVLRVELLEGSRQTALEKPFSILLSEPAAQKYFGTTQVQGKTIQAFAANYEFQITGVFKPFSQQTHFHPDFLISFSTLNDSTVYGRRALETNWGNNAFGTYIVLREGQDPSSLQTKFPDFLEKHYGTFVRSMDGANPDFKASRVTSLQLQKITDLHLRSHLDDELEPPGNINNVYLMGMIGLFIILIATFNFINLSTAQATKRAKEVGIRKVAGAFKAQLIRQYLSESVLIALVACGLAIAASYFALDWLNGFTGKSIELIKQPGLIGFFAAGTVVVGILAGVYPAFVISGFKPALILKGKQSAGKAGLRKALVVVQFSISIVLIIATGIIFNQLQFINNKDLGFAKDKVITLPYYNQVSNTYDAFYNALTNHASIKNAGRSSRIPTGRLLDSMGAQIRIDDSLQNAGIRIAFIRVDHEFFDSYSIPFVAGRNFSKSVRTDDSLGYVLNEAAVRALGYKDAQAMIGEEFQYGGIEGSVIGIVKDFHFESLHQSINPMVFFVRQPFYNNLSIQVAGDSFQAGLDHIEKVWREFLPDRLFEFTMMSERYRNLYQNESRQSQLFTGFALLAIFIACLGLFGLATFNTLQRIKEIGIRKVLGASVPGILTLLSREIVMLVLLANLVAWPIAWYAMNKWLEGFAYRIDMNIGIFILATLVAIVIALLTVGTQTIKAATTNPANTLRYE
ncbi:ABC transporter permease [Oscillatoria amoena NRMC-F 0135]|nr:ABC transporter permease [Oscillatoria amoena NRMC-F 0135]